MADSFRLRAEGQDAIEHRLAYILSRLGNLEPLMQDIGAQLESSTADNFKGEHSPAGVPWKKSVRAIRDGGKTLQNSRRLALSIVSRTSDASVEVGTNVIYARRHNQGFSGTEQIAAHRRVMTQVFGIKLKEPKTVNVKAFSRKGNTPQRQFLGLGPHDAADIEALAATYLDAES
jgi:phage virion morphogenesis protein